MLKKLLSVVLCLVMLAGMVPVAEAASQTVYPAGAEVTITEELATGGDTVTFVPVWEEDIKPYTVKYAVSIFGIKADKDQSGNQIPLTFGPATGVDYTKTYKACDGTSEGSPGNCLHWMTWEQIIAQAKKNPEVFQGCLKNGCTHSVELNITSKIAGTSYQGKMDDGDGAGVLYNSIASNYRKWNNDNLNYGGWPASRIRAVLNGSDEYTADGTSVSSESKIYYNGDNDVAGTDMEGFTSADALISAFPEELQEAIVPRAVVSDTKYNDYTDTDYTFTTYDKLWLFSGAEVYQDSGSNNEVIRTNEGTPYSRTTELNITTSSYAGNKSYNELGSANTWWLRSPIRSFYNAVYGVDASGDWGRDDAYNATLGLAPGFCIG